VQVSTAHWSAPIICLLDTPGDGNVGKFIRKLLEDL